MNRSLSVLLLSGCAACASAGSGGSSGSSGGVSATVGGDSGGTGDDDAGGMTCYGSYGTLSCPPGYSCNTYDPTCFPQYATGGSSGGSRPGSSSGGSSSGGSTGSACAAGVGGPYYDVTLQQVGIHPAELAAFAGKGLKPPSIVGQQLSIQGGALQGFDFCYSTLGSVTITAANQNGPITFSHLPFGGVNLGVIATYRGVDTVNGAPLQPPACAQINPDGGYTDYIAPSGSEVFVGTPAANMTVPASWAVSWDYTTLLDCAQGLAPGTQQNGGFMLLYATQPAWAVDGGLAGVTFQETPAAGRLRYYAADYSAAATGATSANGVATISGATYQLLQVGASAPGLSFAGHEMAAGSGTNYQVYYLPQ